MRLLLCFSGVSPSPLNIPKSGRERKPEQGRCQTMGQHRGSQLGHSSLSWQYKVDYAACRWRALGRQTWCVHLF